MLSHSSPAAKSRKKIRSFFTQAIRYINSSRAKHPHTIFQTRLDFFNTVLERLKTKIVAKVSDKTISITDAQKFAKLAKELAIKIGDRTLNAADFNKPLALLWDLQFKFMPAFSDIDRRLLRTVATLTVEGIQNGNNDLNPPSKDFTLPITLPNEIDTAAHERAEKIKEISDRFGKAQGSINSAYLKYRATLFGEQLRLLDKTLNNLKNEIQRKMSERLISIDEALNCTALINQWVIKISTRTLQEADFEATRNPLWDSKNTRASSPYLLISGYITVLRSIARSTLNSIQAADHDIYTQAPPIPVVLEKYDDIFTRAVGIAQKSAGVDFHEQINNLQRATLLAVLKEELSETEARQLAYASLNLTTSISNNTLKAEDIDTFHEATFPYKKSVSIGKILGALVGIAIGICIGAMIGAGMSPGAAAAAVYAGAKGAVIGAGLGGLLFGKLGMMMGNWCTLWHIKRQDPVAEAALALEDSARPLALKG